MFLTIIIIVMFLDAPQCNAKEPRVLRRMKGVSVVFTCDMKANPGSRLDFKWTLNNSEHNVELQVFYYLLQSGNRVIFVRMEI